MAKMYSKGTLELVTASMEISSIPKEERDKAVLNFFVMKDEADKNGDLFVAFPYFFAHKFSYGQFYNGFIFKSWGDFHNTPSLADISSKTYEYINAFQSKVYSVCNVKTLHDLRDMPNPHAVTGFVKGGNSEIVCSLDSWID